MYRKLAPLAALAAVAALAVPSLASAGGSPPPPPGPTTLPAPPPQPQPLNTGRACGFGQFFLRQHVGDLQGLPSGIQLRVVRLIGALADDDHARVDCAYLGTFRLRVQVRGHDKYPVVNPTGGPQGDYRYRHGKRDHVRFVVRRYACLTDVAVTRAQPFQLNGAIAFNHCVRVRRDNALFPQVDPFGDGPFDDRSPEA